MKKSLLLLALLGLLCMQGCFVGHGGHRGYEHHDHDEHHHD